MFSAPLISLSGPAGTDLDAITQKLMPFLRASTSRAPILASDQDYRTSPAIDHPSSNNRIVLFIDERSTERLSLDAVSKYQAIAKKNARTFIPVALTSAAATSDSETLEVEEDVGKEPEALTYGMEKELVLDVTGMSSEEVAGKIARWVWWVGEFMSWDDDE
ncbi:hypothetical protein CC80DRAFT_492209 [Byssothecium circinans]|uniref:Uncharacterized protein n=1 Tax=Byssothecium circinans TaxID=147558 RepID=A0A6A5TY98_9PLEO|nr:hypothetical protein CC80DRAFT_492209 [Byssothecium circinans]